MENETGKPAEKELSETSEGINQWNDRLDENLESENTGDPGADEKARDYSTAHGSGDQSDEEEND